MGSKGGSFPLFNSWLKQFTLTVFLQSFQAIFLMFTLIMLSEVQKKVPSGADAGAADAILTVIAIACAMALIKFEKMFKKLFGIDESPIGTTAAAGAKMFMGAKSAIDLGKSATGGFQKSRQAGLASKRAEDKYKAKKSSFDNMFGEGSSSGGSGTSGTSGSGSQSSENKSSKSKEAEEHYNNASQQSQNNSGGPVPGSYEAIRLAELREKKQDELKELEFDMNSKKREERKGNIDKYLNVAGTLASVSVGMGAADELSEMLTVANLVNKPLDYATDKYSDARAGRELYKESRDLDEKEKKKEYMASGMSEKESSSKAKYEARGNANFLGNTLTEAIKDGFKDYQKQMKNVSPQKITLDVINTHKYQREKKEIKAANQSTVDGM